MRANVESRRSVTVYVSMAEYIDSLQVSLLAFNAYTGIQTCLVLGPLLRFGAFGENLIYSRMDNSEHATLVLALINGVISSFSWSLVAITTPPAPDVSGCLF